MRRLLPWIVLIAVVMAPGAVSGANQPAIQRLQQVAALTKAQASQALPVSLDATVTVVRIAERSLFVQDGEFASYVRFNRDVGLAPGDRVHIEGVTVDSFRTDIEASQIRMLHHGVLPTARRAKFEELIRGALDARFVEVEGRVLSAEYDNPSGALHFQMKVPQGWVEGVVVHAGKLRPEQLLDADVQMRGVAGGWFNSRMEMAGVWLNVPTGEDVTVAHPALSDPWSLPFTPL